MIGVRRHRPHVVRAARGKHLDRARGRVAWRRERRHDQAHRSPVVVGGRVPELDAQSALHDGQRNAHPGRAAGGAEGHVRRRDPQLLGAEPARQARPDSRATRQRSGSRPTSPGVYRGQCAEFCGLQHAHMALYVIAESQAKFDSVADDAAACRRRARRPTTQRRGRDVFLSLRRASCATRSAARSRAAPSGPDLTHLGVARHHRARDAAEHARPPGRLGARPAGRSSRAAACRRTAMPSSDLQVAADVPGEPQVSVARSPPAQSEADSRPSADPRDPALVVETSARSSSDVGGAARAGGLAHDGQSQATSADATS